MNRTLASLAVVGVVTTGCTGSASPTASPSPSSTPAIGCEVSVSPASFVVNPETGASDDTLFFAGTGFPPNSAVSIFLTGAVLDATTTDAGSFTAEVRPAPEVTHPAPPDIEPGSVTWNVTGWDSPQPPGEFGSVPPRACQTQVTVTIELTHEASPTPPTDLSAGSYAAVVAEGVRVRIEPSVDATVVGALFPGDVVRILAPAVVVEGLAWYQVETVVIQSGQPLRGYVAAGVDGQAFLQPTAAPPPPTPTPSPSPSASL